MTTDTERLAQLKRQRTAIDQEIVEIETGAPPKPKVERMPDGREIVRVPRTATNSEYRRISADADKAGKVAVFEQPEEHRF